MLPNIKKRIARESAYTNSWLVRYVISYSYCQLNVSTIMVTGWLICTLKFIVNLLTCLSVQVNMIMKSDALLY